jgi:excisionase family DNA binding protein
MSLLSVEEAAQRLGTSPRFIRRLIAERRIAFTKLGRHVRIDTKDIDTFIAAGRVEPVNPPRSRNRGVAKALLAVRRICD